MPSLDTAETCQVCKVETERLGYRYFYIRPDYVREALVCPACMDGAWEGEIDIRAILWREAAAERGEPSGAL